VTHASIHAGARLADRITVSGLAAKRAPLVLRLYGPFEMRSAIRCSGAPARTIRMAVRNGTQTSPPVTLTRAGLYTFRASVGGTSTPCRDAAEIALVTPQIITGRNDHAAYVAAPGVGGRTPTRVTIAARGIDAPLVPVGISVSQHVLGAPEQIDQAGWWADGKAPGAKSGTVLIAGHVDSAAEGPGAFFELPHAAVGDRVQVRTRNGRTYTYRVVSVRLYPKAQLPIGVWSRTGPARLVLVTCGGPFDTVSRHYRDNVVVTAVPVS
jgi:hypothetical protein